MINSEPIAAVATGQGQATAVSIVRFSGDNSIALARLCLRFGGSNQPPDYRKLAVAQLVDPDSKDVLDEPMAVFFRGPHSFTGQDSGEIHLHGSPYVVEKALEILFRVGFRQARPGEFSLRAFLNGKFDLTAAEGIKELVDAQSEQQWLAARQLTTGKVANEINIVRQGLVEAMAYLEARIDFPDEGDTQDIELQAVSERVGKVQERIRSLMATFKSGQVAKNGLKVVLSGEPNVGKSTLLNHLLHKDRAIVTEIPGTTRDYIDEPCVINGRMIRLIDTAGIRTTDDPVEKIGVKQSEDLIATADVVVLMCAANSSPDDFKKRLLTASRKNPQDLILLATKSDLPSTDKVPEDWLQISVHDGSGLDALRSALSEKVDQYVAPVRNRAFISSARHHQALVIANEKLDQFNVAVQQRSFEECLAFELREAASALTEIVGDVGCEDILDKVFSEFCVGK